MTVVWAGQAQSFGTDMSTVTVLTCEQNSSRDRCLKRRWKELFGDLKALIPETYEGFTLNMYSSDVGYGGHGVTTLHGSIFLQ